MTHSQLTISTVEMNKTDGAVLQVALGLLAKTGVSASVLPAGDNSGKVLLLDMDSAEGGSFYQQFQPARGQHLVVLTEQTLNDTRNTVLKKPVRVQTLRDVLQDLSAETNKSLSFGASSVDDQMPASKQAFSRDNNLFFVLLKAREESGVLQIFHPPFSPLFVDAANNVVATSASRSVIRRMVQTPSERLSLTKLSQANFEILARGQIIMQFSHVLWSAALFGSQGQLVHGQPDQPMRLKAWPNLSRLDFEPYHMSLASLMAGQALSPLQIQLKTKLSLSQVVGFCNATWVTGLLETAAAETPAPAKAVEEKKMGLFAKIARRLNLENRTDPTT